MFSLTTIGERERDAAMTTEEREALKNHETIVRFLKYLRLPHGWRLIFDKNDISHTYAQFETATIDSQCLGLLTYNLHTTDKEGIIIVTEEDGGNPLGYATHWKEALHFIKKEVAAHRKRVDAELCKSAVWRDGCMLEYVPKHLKTVELCVQAVDRSRHAFQYIPDELKDEVKRIRNTE